MASVRKAVSALAKACVLDPARIKTTLIIRYLLFILGLRRFRHQQRSRISIVPFSLKFADELGISSGAWTLARCRDSEGKLDINLASKCGAS